MKENGLRLRVSREEIMTEVKTKNEVQVEWYRGSGRSPNKNCIEVIQEDVRRMWIR